MIPSAVMPRAHAGLTSLLACSLASACGSVVPPLTFGESSSSTSSEPTSSESSTSSPPSSDSHDFISLDVPPASPSCDPYQQDCPPGEKCNYYADDGGTTWNNTRCVPVFPDPAQLGEPCRARGYGLDGIDDCDVGLMCWDIDYETEIGHCIALCGGSFEDLTCPPGQSGAAYETLCLCLDSCDPLAQDCEPEYTCITNYGDGFLCTFDASGDEGQTHDPCSYANACDPGNTCAPTTAASECDSSRYGCCQPYCDLTLLNTCPGDGQSCVPWQFNDETPPEYANLGYCSLPLP